MIEKPRIPVVFLLQETLMDNWNSNGRTYISAFRTSLEGVARLLGASCRFNPELNCAEIVGDKNIIARISVHGEAGLPENAKVISKRPLSTTTQALFGTALSPLKATFEVTE